MNTIYLVAGSIGTGKSTFTSSFFIGSDMEYISSDAYKKCFFDYSNVNLKDGYRCADKLVAYKLEDKCKKSEDFIYEICPTSTEKILYLKELVLKYQYKIISFFLATDDVDINIKRVENRINIEKGDPIPVEKTHNRYYRSLNSISDIVHISETVYFIDNSSIIEVVACIKEQNLHLFKHSNWLNTFFINKLNKHNYGK
jgi:predicted ABC-type ATPase